MDIQDYDSTKGREGIIQNVYNVLENLISLGIVKRIKRDIPRDDTINEISSIDLPFVIVDAALPDVESTQTTTQSGGALIMATSAVDIQIWVFASDAETPDSTISKLYHYIWAVLMDDPSRGGLATKTEIRTGDVKFYQDPYIGFLVTAAITYQHTKNFA